MTLKKRYDEVMDRIEVTDEMRGRILGNIQKIELEAAPKSNMIPFPNLKKYLSVAACFVVLLVGVFVAGNKTGIFRPNDPAVLTPGDGIVDVGTLKELSAQVGFEVEELNGLPFEVKETTYTVYWQELAEIVYTGEGQTATFRKSVGTEDNSGDYNAYANVKNIQICSLTATLKGNGDAYTLAIWAADGYAYSLSLSDGISEIEWRDIIGS